MWNLWAWLSTTDSHLSAGFLADAVETNRRLVSINTQCYAQLKEYQGIMDSKKYI